MDIRRIILRFIRKIVIVTKYAKIAYSVLCIFMACMSWIIFLWVVGFSLLILLACILTGVLAIGDRAAKFYAVGVILPLTSLIWTVPWVSMYGSPHTIGPLLIQVFFDWFSNHGEWFAALGSLIVGILLATVVLRTVMAKMVKRPLLYFAVVLAALGSAFSGILLPVVLFSDSAFFSTYHTVLFLFLPVMIPAILAVLISTIRRPYQDIVLGAIVLFVLISSISQYLVI